MSFIFIPLASSLLVNHLLSERTITLVGMNGNLAICCIPDQRQYAVAAAYVDADELHTLRPTSWDTLQGLDVVHEYHSREPRLRVVAVRAALHALADERPNCCCQPVKRDRRSAQG